MNSRSAAVVPAALLAWMLAASAHAACNDGDRPPPPGANQGVASSPTSVRFTFTATTLFFDLHLHEGTVEGPLIKKYVGRSAGPSQRGRNGFSFGGLKPSTEYCALIWTRTKEGSEGCTSNAPATVCVATNPPPKPIGVKEVPGTKVGPLLNPSISVQWAGEDAFIVKGIHFTPRAHVTIKVSGKATSLDTIAIDFRRQPIRAFADGTLTARLGRVCNTGVQGDVVFTALDTAKNQSSKPVVLRCRAGARPDI